MCALYVRCALSVLQKECRKVWGVRYMLGARYRSENTVRILLKPTPMYFYKSDHITGLDRPWGFQDVEAPKFQDNRHMKVIRLSALRTGRLYPPPKGNIPGIHFC